MLAARRPLQDLGDVSPQVRTPEVFLTPEHGLAPHIQHVTFGARGGLVPQALGPKFRSTKSRFRVPGTGAVKVPQRRTQPPSR